MKIIAKRSNSVEVNIGYEVHMDAEAFHNLKAMTSRMLAHGFSPTIGDLTFAMDTHNAILKASNDGTV